MENTSTLTPENLFVGLPTTQWGPRTPWGTAIKTVVGKFSLILDQSGKIRVQYSQTEQESFERSPRKYGTLYIGHGGQWLISSAAKTSSAHGEDAHWAAGVATFPSFGAAIEFLAAK
jgi:hypothetical protein